MITVTNLGDRDVDVVAQLDIDSMDFLNIIVAIAASALKEATDELAAVTGLGRVERRLEALSSPARGLHDTAMSEQANLIVVGSTHHGPLGRVLLGSVGERLLADAPCAVAIALPGFESLVTIERGEALQHQEQAAQTALDSTLNVLDNESAIERQLLVSSDAANTILE